MKIPEAFNPQVPEQIRQDRHIDVRRTMRGSAINAVLTVPTALSLLFIAPLLTIGPAHGHGKGIYESRSEAEKRAEVIGCSTVHQNNGKWMPCADEQELHRQLRKH
tara:strand:- start:1468 stop:1785 length:318 start_codon:yes stop_codon:yes gene_type:complete